jgi:hypothetical protein
VEVAFKIDQAVALFAQNDVFNFNKINQMCADGFGLSPLQGLPARL